MTHDEPLDHVDERLLDPDARTLGRHLLSSLVVAALVFVAFVLPAEYGVDPTGLGAATGVSKVYSADPALEATVLDPAPLASAAWRTDVTTIELAPNEGLEFKFLVEEGDALVYTWTVSEGIPLFFDLHAEPDEGPEGYFESYRTGRTADAQGAIVASFTGTHGWFWENTSEFTATITLESAGFYTVKGVERL